MKRTNRSETKQKRIFCEGVIFRFFLLMYVIQHCFTCRPSDSTVSEDAGIEPRTVATLALTARRSNHLARSHPHGQVSSNGQIYPKGQISSTRLDLIHEATSHPQGQISSMRLDLIHKARGQISSTRLLIHKARSYPRGQISSTRLDLVNETRSHSHGQISSTRLDLIHKARSHPRGQISSTSLHLILKARSHPRGQISSTMLYLIHEARCVLVNDCISIQKYACTGVSMCVMYQCIRINPAVIGKECKNKMYLES